jgi:hypothetical protein
MDQDVRRNGDEERYEIDVDGRVGGFTVYRERPGLVAFMHTEVDEQLEGQGVGSRLIASALDDSRERHLAVLPFCPFVNGYIQRHREYADLVPEEYRSHFGLG